MVPAATWHCPNCNFAEMQEVELPAPGRAGRDRAHHDLPVRVASSATRRSARGYVDVATDAPIASFLPSRLRTTTGLSAPGHLRQGHRAEAGVRGRHASGRIRDIFWVPMSEVPAQLRDKKPLLASELDFASPAEPAVTRRPPGKDRFRPAMEALRQMAADVEQEPARPEGPRRPQRTRSASRPAAATSACTSPTRRIRVEDGLPAKADFVIVAEDPGRLHPLGRTTARSPTPPSRARSGCPTRRPSSSCPSSTDCRGPRAGICAASSGEPVEITRPLA